MLKEERLQQAIDQYINVFCSDEDHSKDTISNKRGFYRRLFEYLDGRPYCFETVLEFRTYMYLNWKTQEGHATVTRMLRAFTDWLVRYEYLDTSFSDKLNRPKVGKRITFDYVEPVIVEKIIDAGTEIMPFVPKVSGDNKRNAYIKTETNKGLKFIVNTGLRINEAIGLTGRDLVMESRIPTFWVKRKGSKNGEKQELVIPRSSIQEMRTRASNQRVFEMTEATCNKALKRGCEKLGIKARITCHTLRHIFATAAIKKGEPIAIVSEILGHRKLQMTIDYYMHLDVNDLAKVIYNQETQKSEMTPLEWVNDLEKAIKATGIENTDQLLKQWTRLENGGFTFTVNPK